MILKTKQKLIQDRCEILNLYKKGFDPVYISKHLGYKYPQPIYNLLIKEKLYESSDPSTRYKVRKYNVDENFFMEIDSELKSYIFGFIIADGHVSDHSIIISLNEKDVDILEKIKLAMKSDHKIKYFVKDEKYNHVIIKINSIKLVAQLRNLGVTKNKSLTMGNMIKYIPKEHQISFLRGYFDGDGNIFYGRKYSSGTKYLITVVGTEEFLKTSFDKIFETNCKIAKYKSCNMYSWKIAKRSQVDDFLEILYKDAKIYLDRKYESAHVKSYQLLETPKADETTIQNLKK